MSAAMRRDERIAAAHAAATAPNRWRCPLGCHGPDDWQPEPDKAAAFTAADEHYTRVHHTPTSVSLST